MLQGVKVKVPGAPLLPLHPSAAVSHTPAWCPVLPSVYPHPPGLVSPVSPGRGHLAGRCGTRLGDYVASTVLSGCFPPAREPVFRRVNTAAGRPSCDRCQL